MSDFNENSILIEGNILFLTDDLDLFDRQLKGETLSQKKELALMDNISTDEITPARVCYYYDKTLGEYCLSGLRGDLISKDSIKKGNYEVIVSGYSKGCGSSRETAPYSEFYAGVKLIVAKSIEKIYLQNCQNIGLLTTTDFSVIDKIIKNEPIKINDLLDGYDEISSEIVRQGGLFNYSKLRMNRKIDDPCLNTKKRPMTIIEKIIAQKTVRSDISEKIGVAAVKPGDSVWVEADLRFSHEYVTPMAEFLFKEAFGEVATVEDPSSVLMFRDHLIFIDEVLRDFGEEGQLLKLAKNLSVVQEKFAKSQGIKVYNGTAICHTGIMEDYALPGQIIVGTDSHTCTAGSLGSFSFGIGATDMANAWMTKEVRVTVPETVLIILEGQLAPQICAKDIALKILSLDYIKEGRAIGKVIEFSGEALKEIQVEERATLTNMAVEFGAFTGVVEPDEITCDYLSRIRGLSKNENESKFIFSDKDAVYSDVIRLDLSQLETMIALPGDPHNGIAISKLISPIKIDIAYGGSCTGGKMKDMDMYAEVLLEAKQKGKKIHKDVNFYIQFSSYKVKEYAKEKGYIQLFMNMGVVLLDPGCGACINSGPGITTKSDEVAISSINRNFKGRSGKGQIYLAGPFVVAKSAISGYITEIY